MPTVANPSIMLVASGRNESPPEKILVKFPNVYAGGSSCVVHSPSVANARIISMMNGSSIASRNTHVRGASTASARERFFRIYALPVRFIPAREPRTANSTPMEKTLSNVEYAAASANDPFNFALYISVVMNRMPPPNSSGAENDARLEINTSNPVRTKAGVICGTITRKNMRVVPAPSSCADSISDPSSVRSASSTKK